MSIFIHPSDDIRTHSRRKDSSFAPALQFCLKQSIIASPSNADNLWYRSFPASTSIQTATRSHGILNDVDNAPSVQRETQTRKNSADCHPSQTPRQSCSSIVKRFKQLFSLPQICSNAGEQAMFERRHEDVVSKMAVEGQLVTQKLEKK